MMFSVSGGCVTGIFTSVFDRLSFFLFSLCWLVSRFDVPCWMVSSHYFVSRRGGEQQCRSHTHTSLSLVLSCSKDRRWWKPKGFEDWLMGAVPQSCPLSPWAEPEQRTANYFACVWHWEGLELVRKIVPRRFHLKDVRKGSTTDPSTAQQLRGTPIRCKIRVAPREETQLLLSASQGSAHLEEGAFACS